jgi:hypothetical protein
MKLFVAVVFVVAGSLVCHPVGICVCSCSLLLPVLAVILSEAKDPCISSLLLPVLRF